MQWKPQSTEVSDMSAHSNEKVLPTNQFNEFRSAGKQVGKNAATIDGPISKSNPNIRRAAMPEQVGE